MQMITGESSGLVGYRDYEQIMINLAMERGWEFEFDGESVPAPAVFNQTVYAPALLVAANKELEMRSISCDLGFEVGGEQNSLFGAKITFPAASNNYLSQIMRIGTTAMIIESLPRNGNTIQLDALQYILGEEYSNFVAPKDVE